MVNRFFGFSCKMDAVLYPFEIKYVMSYESLNHSPEVNLNRN